MLFFIAGRGILADCREILCWLAHVYGFEGCGASFAECGAPVNLKGLTVEFLLKTDSGYLSFWI